jgi:hypothetical protein
VRSGERQVCSGFVDVRRCRAAWAGGSVAGCGGGVLWSGCKESGAFEEEEIDDQDDDEDEAADEDVGAEAHDGFVLWKIGGRDVVWLVIAFVHGDQLIRKSVSVRQ